jgi:hypothetical protein
MRFFRTTLGVICGQAFEALEAETALSAGKEKQNMN